MPPNVALSTDLWIQARPAIGCHLEQRDLDVVSFASRPLCLKRPCCILGLQAGTAAYINLVPSVAIYMEHLNEQEQES